MRRHAVIMLFDQEPCLFHLFGHFGDLRALVLQLPVESRVRFGHLPQVAANALGHGQHCGLVGLFRGGL